MVEDLPDEHTALNMAKREIGHKLPGAMVFICFGVIIALLIFPQLRFGFPLSFWGFALAISISVLWTSFETKYWIKDESPKTELHGFPPFTVNPKHLATTIPAETEKDPTTGEVKILRPPFRIDHIGGTIIPGHYGIHFAISMDLPGVEELTPEGSKMWGEYKIRPFSKLRPFIKERFVDEDGNNISPKRKYKPGKSLFFVSERLVQITEHPGIDLTPQLDRLQEDKTRLKASLDDAYDINKALREPRIEVTEKKEIGGLVQ